jgi:hypothetical protein
MANTELPEHQPARGHLRLVSRAPAAPAAKAAELFADRPDPYANLVTIEAAHQGLVQAEATFYAMSEAGPPDPAGRLRKVPLICALLAATGLVAGAWIFRT